MESAVRESEATPESGMDAESQKSTPSATTSALHPSASEGATAAEREGTADSVQQDDNVASVCRQGG